ncbi:MAG: ATP-dependent carboxylate-amine ligase, partial [Muribaculum sp.]|nr:ATP-dependent carboxylate-amine ligase [Muribaculum sp.]
MPNILFTCAGRRTYLLKYFKNQLGSDGNIIGTDMQLSAPALTVADVKEQVPAVYADNYIDCILKICKRNSVDAIICLNDLELPILAANKERFEAIGITPIVSTSAVIDICFDKYLTAQYVESIGLNSPKTFVDLDDTKVALTKGD